MGAFSVSERLHFDVYHPFQTSKEHQIEHQMRFHIELFENVAITDNFKGLCAFTSTKVAQGH